MKIQTPVIEDHSLFEFFCDSENSLFSTRHITSHSMNCKLNMKIKKTIFSNYLFVCLVKEYFSYDFGNVCIEYFRNNKGSPR